MSASQRQLFMVEWEEGGSWDTYSEFVVCCNTEEEAKQTHPDGSWLYDKDTLEWYQLRHDGSRYAYHCSSWIKAAQISELKIVHIGTPLPSIKKGVVLASYHAG